GPSFALAVLLLAGFAATALTQDYPTRPIRIIVPFAAGGAVDVLARLIGVKLSDAFGQAAIVENRPGAGGNIGADVVAKAPLDAALIAVDVDVAIVPVATARPLIEGGQLRALAVTSATRVPALPNVPTIAEDALPGFEVSGWQAFFLPAHSPPDVVRLLARTTATVLAIPEVAVRVRAMGNEPVGSTPEEFDARFKADLAAFAKVIREAHIPLQD